MAPEKSKRIKKKGGLKIKRLKDTKPDDKLPGKSLKKKVTVVKTQEKELKIPKKLPESSDSEPESPKKDEKLEKTVAKKDTLTAESNQNKGGKQSQQKKKKYYVLFLGNLPYDTTQDEIREHFVRCGVIEDVRILTNKETGKPRGCAYIQFEEMRGHKNALMLHKSSFKGREINVEFTAPGRKSANRNMRLQEKNKRLAKHKLSRDCILSPGQSRNKFQKKMS